MIIHITEPVSITPTGAWRVVYERRDRRGAGVLIVPHGTPGQDRLRRGAVVEVTRSRGARISSAPLATMRMAAVVAAAA